jgi:hypothetical protein
MPFPNEPLLEAWTDDRDEWESATRYMRRQYPNITLFQTKVLYVFGMMRHLLEASGHAMSNTGSFLFPAYLLACGAVELLGRCVMESGETTHFQRGLLRGLERMILVCQHCGRSDIRGDYSNESWHNDEQHIVVSVNGRDYSIEYWKGLRNYMAHGMVNLNSEIHFTRPFLGRFICRASQGIDRYYQQLRAETAVGEEMRLRFVANEVTPIWDNSGPIHISHLYDPLIVRPFANPCGSILYEDGWRRYCA